VSSVGGWCHECVKGWTYCQFKWGTHGHWSKTRLNDPGRDLENKLNLALAALEAKNSEIDNLNLLLSQERNRNDNHRNEHDQAYAERAEVLAILCNVRAMLEKTETPLHLRRKRNGNVVADNGSGQVVIEGGGRSSAKSLANADTSRAELVS
jgi:hypothetical protein